MEDKRIIAEKMLEEIKESGDLSIVKEMIKDNVIIFNIEDKKYRVRLLNLHEKEELDELRRKKFGKLIQDRDILLEKDLIQNYKERGINIDEIKEKRTKVEAEIINLRLAQGESISKNEGENILKTYQEKIDPLEIERQVLYLQETTLLEFSLENQLLTYISEIITYLGTEIEVDGTWQRLWKTLEDFKNYKNDKLINKAGVASMLLQYSEF